MGNKEGDYKGDYMYVLMIALTYFAQTERWIYKYNGPGNADDRAVSIIYGDDGNIYAAGQSSGSGTGLDFTVISLTSDGRERWVYTYNGSANSDDIAKQLVFGSDGNIYACGYSIGATSSSDFIVISLTESGGERWVYRYNGTGNGDDIANSIVIGLDNHIYAAGASIGAGTGTDYVIAKLDTAGNESWIYRYDWTGGSDGAYNIIYSVDHNLHVAGYSYHFVQYIVFTIVSIDTAGGFRWVYRTQGTGIVDEAAYSLVNGPNNSIFCAGKAFLIDFTVSKLDSTGNDQWTFIYGQPGYSDCANVVISDNISKIYVGGYLTVPGNGHDFVIAKLDATNGDTSWIYRYNGSGNANDEAYSVIYGLDGNIYAAGFSNMNITGSDFTIVKVDSSGNQDWVYHYNGNCNGTDIAYSLVYGLDNYIYAAGYSQDSATSYEFTVISLPSDLSVREEKKIVKGDNYSATILNGPLQLPEDKKYRVFDITGREVRNLNPAPGIYFIEIDGKIVNKIIKIK